MQLLIVKQILLVSILGNLCRTLWRICILIILMPCMLTSVYLKFQNGITRIYINYWIWMSKFWLSKGLAPLFFFHTHWFGFYYEENCSYMYDPQQISVFLTSVLLYRWKKDSPLQMRGMELVPHLLTMLPHKVHMTKLKMYFFLYNFLGISRLKFMINPFTPRSDQG